VGIRPEGIGQREQGEGGKRVAATFQHTCTKLMGGKAGILAVVMEDEVGMCPHELLELSGFQT
jgi:hypothetical protein